MLSLTLTVSVAKWYSTFWGDIEGCDCLDGGFLILLGRGRRYRAQRQRSPQFGHDEGGNRQLL